ncbi:MAG: FCD domain-containing protein [Nocardioides sp.]|uniref:FCD domain-containing protein n=1 Tax=Nocardioides sp. TaxID=35761 RepID=UPI0039E438D2
MAARLAALRASREQREQLQNLAEMSFAAATFGAEVDGDATVHRMVFAMVRNRHLQNTLDHYFNLGLRMWYLALERITPVDRDEHVDHRPLAAAIKAGDGDLARTLLQEHIAHDSQIVRDILNPA